MRWMIPQPSLTQSPRIDGVSVFVLYDQLYYLVTVVEILYDFVVFYANFS